jgi:transketolase
VLTSEVQLAGPKVSLRQAFAETVGELAAEDPRVVLLDGDVALSAQTDGFARRFPERFFEIGIAEQNLVGAAAGLATMGYLPFVSTFACFQVYRAHDQIRVLVAQTHLPVKLIGGAAGLLFGSAGKSHQTPDDLATLRAMPGMTVVCPADDIETRQVIRWSLDYDAPLYVRLTRSLSPRVFGEDHVFTFPAAVRLHAGRDLAIITSGVQTTRVLEALPLLEAQGVDPTVIHVPTLKPLDEDAIEEAAREAGRLVVVEDHSVLGGLGGAVCEVVAERYPVPVRRIGISDMHGASGPTLELLQRYGLSGDAVAATIVGWLAEQDR